MREQVIVAEGTPGARWTRSGQWIASGEVVLEVGGAWDLVDGEFAANDNVTNHGRVELSVHPGQVPAVEWFSGWLEDYIAGVRSDDEDFSCILSGGQRAGKTWIACVFAASFAIAIPDSIVWIVCPTEAGFEEVHDVLSGPDGILAGSWYDLIGDHYWFANGSRIVLRSANDPESLKVGRCDLLVLNECQMIKKKAEAIARMRVADRGGMVIGCANPPDSPRGEWVGDWVAETESGERAGRHFWFNPFDNPHVDHRRLRELETQMDAKTFAVEILGKFFSVGDVVLHNWDRLVNETTLAKLAAMFGVESLQEITRHVTKRLEGRAFDRVLGVDVQKSPMTSAELRFFENPLAPLEFTPAGDPVGDNWWRWCFGVFTDEVVLDGQEEDLVEGWNAKGWDPEETLIISDASAKWQFAERDPVKVEAKRRQVKGRGSWAVFRNGGFRHIRPPDRQMDKNPEVLERCRATTSRIAVKRPGPYGQHFLFALSSCKGVCRAIRKWPTAKYGQPSRDSEHAHLGDCVTYPVHRLYPRRPRSRKTITTVKRVQGRARLRGW